MRRARNQRRNIEAKQMPEYTTVPKITKRLKAHNGVISLLANKLGATKTSSVPPKKSIQPPMRIFAKRRAGSAPISPTRNLTNRLIGSIVSRE